MSPRKDDPVETIAATAPAPKVSMGIKSFSLASKPGSKPMSFATRNPNAGSLSSSDTAQSSPSTSSTRLGEHLTSKLGKRPRTQLHNDSDEEEEEIRHEEVTGFDIQAGGALKKSEVTKEALVIPKLKTRDWREEIRRARQGRNLLPPEVQAQRRATADGKDGMEVSLEGDGVVKWGLTITKKTTAAVEDGDAGDVQKSQEDTKVEVETTTVGKVVVELPLEKTDDELALEALMGKRSEKQGPDLVIPAAKTNGSDENEYTRPRNEEDAYRRAILNAPDVSTLEDYERVPVEEFGAALLRGMGWKEGDVKKGRVERPKEVKRRQNLLGLGATELKGAEELGAWVQKSDPKRLGSSSSRGHERRPRANEYREREERKRESRDDRYGSHRRDRDDYRDRDRDHRR